MIPTNYGIQNHFRITITFQKDLWSRTRGRAVQHWNIFWKVPQLKRQKGKSFVFFWKNCFEGGKKRQKETTKENYTGEENKRKVGNVTIT